MTEASLEELVQERQFAGILQTHAERFFRLSNTMAAAQEWNKRHLFQLINEADALESFLDDYGARFNQTYAFFTELVASLRGFAQTGYAIEHLQRRVGSYGSALWDPEHLAGSAASLDKIKAFLHRASLAMFDAARSEARRVGVELTPEAFPESDFLPVLARRRLPRNLGEAQLVDEEQRIAEVASKYLQACNALAEIGVRKIEDPEERRKFLGRACTEEQARFYEATVHNLQSSYDTHIQNTVLEARDDRLPKLRGYVSAALHLLEAVTHLVHFIERHEDEIRSEEAKSRISAIVDRVEVQEITLNELLVWAGKHLQCGYALAEDLLPEYTNVQESRVSLPAGVSFHARPAALIVAIVNHYGTPVQMELGGQRSNAASILELLVAAGSHADERSYTFHGDERPLRDIALLFDNGLGEAGVDKLPDQLGYLRND